MPSPDTLGPVSEEELGLWQRARDGDEEARADVAVRAEEAARAFLRRRPTRGIDVEELVQALHLDVFELLEEPAGGPQKNLDAFLQFKTWPVFNRLVRELRIVRERFERVDVNEPNLDREPDEGNDDERLDALRGCRERLAGIYAVVMNLRFGRGLSPQEAARELGVTTNVVNVRQHRAYEMLRACMRARGFGA